MNLTDYSHNRYNPLTGEWLLVSPHRTKRPWLGKTEEPQKTNQSAYDPDCYLCPGNMRAGGFKNPDYQNIFVFQNDFSALLDEGPNENLNEKNILIAKSEKGICRVICFSPRHDLTLALMEKPMVQLVVEEWIRQYEELGSIDYIRHVQIFENKGAIMGCSNPHPHGQIWANENIPLIPLVEGQKQKEYLNDHHQCLLCEYINLELKKKERIIFENTHFVCLVPFWAVWPYEIMILPKDHLGSIKDMGQDHRHDLADAINRITIRYDNLFLTSFPYSMGIHQKPTDNQEYPEWHFHLHFLPPLLRSASVKKFMVGYELLSMPQRDITAEQSAEKIRNCSEKHYTVI